MTAAPTTPEHIRAKVATAYRRGLDDLLLDPGMVLSYPIHGPTARQALADQAATASWIDRWRRVTDLEVAWKEVDWRRGGLGSQQIPARATATGAQAIATAAGESAHYADTLRKLGILGALADEGVCTRQQLCTLVRHWQVLPDLDLRILSGAAQWLGDNPRSNFSPRAVPVEGMHSKWLETHTTLLKKILDTEDLGLRLGNKTIRLLVLDPQLRYHPGQRDLSVPVDQLASACQAPRVVIMVENKESLLVLPDYPPGSGVIAVWGGGHTAASYAALPHIHGAHILYFGDLDTAGFGILNQLRAAHPRVTSVLMDLATVEKHLHLAVPHQSGTQPAMLSHLTPAEQQAYQYLHSRQLRIEQERLHVDLLLSVLEGSYQILDK